MAPAQTPADHVQTEGMVACHSYRKSLRLSSDQIVSQAITGVRGCFYNICNEMKPEASLPAALWTFLPISVKFLFKSYLDQELHGDKAQK